MRRDYELAFIINPEVSEEGTRAILDRVEQIVATYGGQIVKVNQWGRRRLAYPIERHRDGFYVFIDMILTPETVIELERTLKVSEVVLRHMVKKRDHKAVQKEREEREARARGCCCCCRRCCHCCNPRSRTGNSGASSSRGYCGVSDIVRSRDGRCSACHRGSSRGYVIIRLGTFNL